MKPLAAERSVAFAIGTGRCGTTFLHKLISGEPNVRSSHCRHPLTETFHRYCQWNKLPVDDEGFLQCMADGIQDDHRHGALSFESSPYLSLSIAPLFRRFDASFVFLVRDPVRVVESHLAKGWYDAPYVKSDDGTALGVQKTKHFHHFLGRIAPSDDTFNDWNHMSQVGKCAWYWATLNRAIRDQLKRVPDSNWIAQKLEELDYEAYLALTDHLNISSVLSRREFNKLSKSKPNSIPSIRPSESWTAQEWNEFNNAVQDEATYWGYSLATNVHS